MANIEALRSGLRIQRHRPWASKNHQFAIGLIYDALLFTQATAITPAGLAAIEDGLAMVRRVELSRSDLRELCRSLIAAGLNVVSC